MVEYFEFIINMRIGVIKDWVKPGQSALFGDIRLKPMQIAILNCNKDNDVLVNLPTGFGKSLLFQYQAAQLQDKCIVVFVPLRALLWDCLKQAELHNLTSSQCDPSFIRKYSTHNFLPQLLFLTPERLFQNQTVMSFIEFLHCNNQIELFVIDEAHCISEWGSDFRPDYAKLNKIKSMFPGVRVLGMSATIPPQAIKDLVVKLQVVGCYYFQSSSNRANLIYQVQHTEKSKISSSIIQYVRIKNLKNSSGIIYCQTIKNSEQVFAELQKSNFQCCLFHSKMSEKQRGQNFDRFMNGEIKCIVATICFGMGVNKKNIRYVINVGISLSAENYYQQSGRAGRDGQVSFCLLLTYKSDIQPLQYLINQSTKSAPLAQRRLFKLQQLKVYSKANQCRKKALFKLLGQQFSVEQCKKTCDYCVNDKGNIAHQTKDYSQKGYLIIEQMQKYKQNLTKIQLAKFLKGTGSLKNKVTQLKYKSIFEIFKSEKKEHIELLVETMISRGLLIIYNERFKFGKMSRFVQYLKPCTKAQLNKQKNTPLNIIISIVQNRNLVKAKSQGQNRFEKYIVNKNKSLDKCQPQLPFQNKYNIKQQDQDLKQIKMVQNIDYEPFFDQLFPENAHISKDNHDAKIEEFNYMQELEGHQYAEAQKDYLHAQLEDPYFQEMMMEQKKDVQSQKQEEKIKEEKRQVKEEKLDVTKELKKSKERKINKSQDEDSDNSLLQLIRRKKQEIKTKSQELNNKKDTIIRKKIIQKMQFL